MALAAVVTLVALEFIAAAALIIWRAPFALVGAVVSAGLGGAFAAAFFLARRLPHPVTCHCFGRFGGGTISGRTAVTAVLIVAAAVLVAVHPALGWFLAFAAYPARLLALLPALIIAAGHLRQRRPAAPGLTSAYSPRMNGARS